MSVTDIKTSKEFNTFTKADNLVVIHFYADWAVQCRSMNEIIDTISTEPEYKTVKFAKCLAEDLPEVSVSQNISSVPTFLLYRDSKVVDRIDGANSAQLTSAIHQQLALKPKAASPVDLDAKLRSLINAGPVVLFMKGSAAEPKCGFSRTIIGILDGLTAEYKTFNILNDEEVRQGLKTFSNWPTYPQLYIKGELLGGLDIVKEMQESGELEDLLPKKQDLDDRLKVLVNKSDVMVFMKGDRNEPLCGFSRQLIQILNDEVLPYETFDILSDEEVRQGLKKFSNWPTYPQVYVKGELLGGLDIIKEMKESSELATALRGQS